MKISIIGGTGNLGKGLAIRLAQVGHHIILGSRTEEKAINSANEIKEMIPGIEIEGMGNSQAAQRGEAIILSVPYKSLEETLVSIKEQAAGKVVVDTTVALIPGKPPTTQQLPEGSAAEKAQHLLGDNVQVVSAFHTISAHLLQELNHELSGDTLVAGNDKEAKQLVMTLAEEIGLRALNAGPLKVSSTLEKVTALVIGMNIRYKKKSIGVNFSNI